MTLVNRPLFLHPRVIWRVCRHPVVFAAEPGPGSEQLEHDATTLFNALEPLIEVLNLAGYELLGAAWSPNAVAADPVTYVSFETMLARSGHAGWAETVGVSLPAGSTTALALRIEPRIASGFTPPLADPAELTYALGLDVAAPRWITSRAQPPSLSTVTPGWLIHLPTSAPDTLGKAVAALGPTRPMNGGSTWIGKSDLGAVVAELSRQVFDSWTADGGGGMLRMLLPQWWEVNPRHTTAELITGHLQRALFTDTNQFNGRIDVDGTDAERGQHLADVLSWTLQGIVRGIHGLFMTVTKRFREDLATMYGDGIFAAALAESDDRFTVDPLLVDVMVLLSTGLLSLKSRDPRWSVNPVPGSPRIGEEPFPAPIEPTWSSTNVTGFYHLVLPVPEITLPDKPYDDLGPVLSFAPTESDATELGTVFAGVWTGVEMLQLNQAGHYLEGQWQGRSANLVTDRDGDGVTEVHRVGVTHGTISAQLDPSSDPQTPAYEGVRRLPAATNPRDTDVVEQVRLEFGPNSRDTMQVRLIVGEEVAVFARRWRKVGDSYVDVVRPHLADRELSKSPVETRMLLWGSQRAPLHPTELALLLWITEWIAVRIDDSNAVFGSAEAEEEIVRGVPELMSYFGPEQLAYAQVQLRYVLDQRPYHGGVLGSIFGDEQNYWQALLVAINDIGGSHPELLETLGITQEDIDAVLAEHHRYHLVHGTASTAWAAKAGLILHSALAEEAAKAAWEVAKLGVKTTFVAINLAEFPIDGDLEPVTFTFNKMRLKDPDNPDSDLEVDPEAVDYPATLQGLQLTGSLGFSVGIRLSSTSDTVIRTGRDQWSPSDWAGVYAIFQYEIGYTSLFVEDIPDALQWLIGHVSEIEEGWNVGFIYFYRWQPGSLVPEVAWSFSDSFVEQTGLHINFSSVGASVGFLCENLDFDDVGAFFDDVGACLRLAVSELPPLDEERMESGAALTATATGFLANASRVHDVGDSSGLDAVGSFVAKNLNALRSDASSLLVHGHASPDGSELHNRCLSERRVEYVQRMVATMLGADFAVHPQRIIGLGLGESVSQEFSHPNDPAWRVVELAVNSAGMRLSVEAMPGEGGP